MFAKWINKDCHQSVHHHRLAKMAFSPMMTGIDLGHGLFREVHSELYTQCLLLVSVHSRTHFESSPADDSQREQYR